MAELVIEMLERSYGAFKAVDRIGFTVDQGSFVTLLGPSGCGKSTTLWLIAGLDQPTGGRIRFGGDVLADAAAGTFIPAEARDFGLVFQSYALWPHMSVRQNLDFPLRLRRLPRAERQARIEEALALVELDGQADKYPYQLSGGQQQRVALARTLVYRPRLLLLDEPLSNLDAKLRERARHWLRDLQRKLGITTLYVTHDQHEALAMSDRIIVMNGGRIVQDGRPEEVYRRPSNGFVADFIGSSMFFGARALSVSGEFVDIKLDNGPVVQAKLSGPSPRIDVPMRAALRPERVRVLAPDAMAGPGHSVITAELAGHSYQGARYQLDMRAGDLTFRVETEEVPVAAQLRLAIPADAWMLLPQT